VCGVEGGSIGTTSEGRNTVKTDNRLVGTTAENVFLSLLNQQGIFANPFDTAGFDGIAFDLDRRVFVVGEPPFYVQIKCRGAKGEKFNPQGHSQKTIDDIRAIGRGLNIEDTSLYFVTGFFNRNDIRNISFFVVPFVSLEIFKGKEQYRFSFSRCQSAMKEDSRIKQI
jgi:hypothetical protein